MFLFIRRYATQNSPGSRRQRPSLKLTAPKLSHTTALDNKTSGPPGAVDKDMLITSIFIFNRFARPQGRGGWDENNIRFEFRQLRKILRQQNVGADHNRNSDTIHLEKACAFARCDPPAPLVGSRIDFSIMTYDFTLLIHRAGIIKPSAISLDSRACNKRAAETVRQHLAIIETLRRLSRIVHQVDLLRINIIIFRQNDKIGPLFEHHQVFFQAQLPPGVTLNDDYFAKHLCLLIRPGASFVARFGSIVNCHLPINYISIDGPAGPEGQCRNGIRGLVNQKIVIANELGRLDDLRRLEEKLRAGGYKSIVGLDEAGRGPLAGPVVAAAVILPDGFDLDGLDDSKKLTPTRRDIMFDRIVSSDAIYAVGIIDNDMIDRINILRASLHAMAQATGKLNRPPDFVLVDGNQTVPNIDYPQLAVVGGDALCPSISAASILAKVTRDRIMDHYAKLYPQFSFVKHKGYPTAEHLKELRLYGPTPIHRKTFRPVQEAISQLEMALTR